MKYNCELCNYLTDDRTAYYQHKKTKKHQENVSKQPSISKLFPEISKDFQLENNNTDDQIIILSEGKREEETRRTITILPRCSIQ